MYIYIYVYMYIYIYICMYVCMYIYIYIWTYIHTESQKLLNMSKDSPAIHCLPCQGKAVIHVARFSCADFIMFSKLYLRFEQKNNFDMKHKMLCIYIYILYLHVYIYIYIYMLHVVHICYILILFSAMKS